MQRHVQCYLEDKRMTQGPQWKQALEAFWAILGIINMNCFVSYPYIPGVIYFEMYSYFYLLYMFVFSCAFFVYYVGKC